VEVLNGTNSAASIPRASTNRQTLLILMGVPERMFDGCKRAELKPLLGKKLFAPEIGHVASVPPTVASSSVQVAACESCGTHNMKRASKRARIFLRMVNAFEQKLI